MIPWEWVIYAPFRSVTTPRATLLYFLTIYFQQAISYVRVQVISLSNISALCGAFDANDPQETF